MEKKDSIGMQIKLERIRRGWSQEYLAMIAGCSASMVGKIEKGTRNNPSYIEVLKKILGL